MTSVSIHRSNKDGDGAAHAIKDHCLPARKGGGGDSQRKTPIHPPSPRLLCASSFILCSKRFAFMRELQICSLKKLIEFDPFCSKKAAENYFSFFTYTNTKADFASFQPLFWQKWVKSYQIWTLRPDLESSHQGESCRRENGRLLKTLLAPIEIWKLGC